MRTILRVLSVLIVLIAALTMVNMVLPGLKKEGERDIYFTDVQSPSITYPEKNTTWLLTVHNENCTPSTDGNDSFFFKFYLDNEIWWNEYNATRYRVWNCSKGTSVLRIYTIPPWETLWPLAYNLKIELYWNEGNRSTLEDVVSLPLTILVRAKPNNIIIFSYLTVYLIGLALFGFYLLIIGRTEFVLRRDPGSGRNPRPLENGSVAHPLSSLSVVWVYVFIFASWQVVNTIAYFFVSIELPILLIAQLIFIALIVKVIEKENLSPRAYGWKWPQEGGKFVLMSLGLAILYVLVYYFGPMIFAVYYVYPSLSLQQMLVTILTAAVMSVTSETIFRSFILRKLTRSFGFPVALFATSLMFAFYSFPLFPFVASSLIYGLISLFLLGLFLGLLYRRTRKLVFPIVFYAAFMVLRAVTPIEAITLEYVKLLLEFVGFYFSVLLLFGITEQRFREN